MSGKWLSPIIFIVLASASSVAAAPPEAFDAFKRNDYAAVLRVCEAPAKAGDSVCQDMLGVLYSEGHGVARDQATAFHWFQLAAAQGNATAEYNLALAFERGEGVAKDIAEAEKWYAKSAAAGVPYAQWRLGAIAIDLHNDWKSGVKWLRPAAAQGLTGAQALLGSAYERGLGVKKNEKLAAKWYETAADHGYAPAQSSLAGLYERGAGVDQDFKESYFWYAVALRDPKDPSAKQDAEGLKRVAAKLSAADVGDAAEIAKDWKPEEEVVGSKSRRTASSRSRGPRLRATGTGFYIAHDGSLITNNHVVAECTSMRISDGGDGIPAKVVAVDPDRDWRCSKHPSPSMPWLHSDPIRAASARISWLSAFPSADF